MTDTLHIAFTVVWGTFTLIVLGVGAVAFGRRFRAYTVATIILLLAFGVWTGIDSPKLQANEPTPWIGVAERVNIGVYMLWIAVLAVALLQKPTRSAAKPAPKENQS
jgi:hypothetical protein